MDGELDAVVIGAGISGLAAAKNLIQDGLKVAVIEATDHVGGLWQFTEDGYGVMSFTHINVSKHNYCFSDFPFPDGTCCIAQFKMFTYGIYMQTRPITPTGPTWPPT